MIKKILFSIALLMNGYVNLKIFYNAYSPILVLFWVLSIGLLLVSFANHPKVHFPKFIFSKKQILLLIFILLPTFMRVINFEEKRIHQDTYITAYFSATTDFQKVNFFSEIPQDQGEWVSQFPTPFFILQKIFFFTFGIFPLSVKFSVMPYILATSLLIFLVTKTVFNTSTAAVTLILYGFFGASLYLDTLGLHIASSDAVFMAFVYFLILGFKRKKIFYSLLAGIFAALCYLTYQSSYIALPLLAVFFLIELIREKKIVTVKKYFLIILAFLFTFSPFFVYSSRFHDYLFVRFKQVSFANETKNLHQNPLFVIQKNLKTSLESLYKEGIGGIGGYDFGHLALFEKISLMFFIGGVLLIPVVFLKKPETLFFWGIFVAAFLGGIVITIMPPNFHRLAVAFPAISIISSIPFYLLISTKKISQKIKLAVLSLLLIVYSLSNLNHFLEMVKIDKKNNHADIEHVKVIDYIKSNFPGRQVYIAAFPSFALKKVYYFWDPGKKVVTDFHDNLLKNFVRDEKYVYIILFPNQFNAQFERADPNGKIISNVSTVYSLFVN